jgi:hypothetical protein
VAVGHFQPLQRQIEASYVAWGGRGLQPRQESTILMQMPPVYNGF